MKKTEENREEILNTALKGKENPFNVPASFFDDLPGKINDQILALESLETENVKNVSIDPFEIPDKYFEELPGEISGQINRQDSGIPSIFTRLQKPRIAIPIAFATVLFLAGLYFYKLNCYNDNISHVKELTSDELDNSTFIQSMDEDLLVELIDNKLENSTDDTIEKYLLDNDIEISQIENEL